MLKTRVLTAVILGPLFVLGIFTLSAPLFALLAGIIVILGSWEWTRISGYRHFGPRFAGVAVIAAGMFTVYITRQDAALPVLTGASLLWLAVAAILYARRHHDLLRWPAPLRWIAGIWVLVPAWLAVSLLQETRPAAALLLFLLIWSADSGAYFAGRRWGRRKLAPAISPGKSVEGVWGGVAAAALVAVVFAWYWGLGPGPAAGLVAWSAFTALLSVFGDLFESNCKRLAGVKDSGDLLPGHGGVLDRIDSLTVSGPFFAAGWLWWFASVST